MMKTGFTPNRGRKRDALPGHGFTLVEVLVASLILLFAMAGIVPFFLGGLSHASDVRYKSIATNIARQKVEQIRQLDYREIESAEFLASRFGTSETQRGISFDIDYAVNEEAYGAGKLKRVTVTVSWNGTTYVSPASVTTLIHQQFLGPRISRVEIYPTKKDYGDATPFPRLHDKFLGETVGTEIKIYIAESDWGLVLENLNQPTETARNVYARVVLYDDRGLPYQLGDPADDYKITQLVRVPSSPTSGPVQELYFRSIFSSTDIPDGYWNVWATAYNQYDEPGNTWRLRVRVENGPPDAPTVAAAPRPDNNTVDLDWVAGEDRDLAYLVLGRQKYDWATAQWTDVETLDPDLDPSITSRTDEGYLDLGDPEACVDPWGSEENPNLYRYLVWAVDTLGRTGPPGTADVLIPDSSTTTTTEPVWETTTTASTTTTTLASGTVYISNEDNKAYTVTIKGSADYGPYTAAKNATTPIAGLAMGSYTITATAAGRPTRTASFSLPADNEDIVLQILR